MCVCVCLNNFSDSMRLFNFEIDVDAIESSSVNREVYAKTRPQEYFLHLLRDIDMERESNSESVSAGSKNIKPEDEKDAVDTHKKPVKLELSRENKKLKSITKKTTETRKTSRENLFRDVFKGVSCILRICHNRMYTHPSRVQMHETTLLYSTK